MLAILSINENCINSEVLQLWKDVLLEGLTKSRQLELIACS